MSTISRNRDDYSRKTQIMMQAMADVLFNGDLDQAWNSFFETSERMAPQFAAAPDEGRPARLHLRATPNKPTLNNQPPETTA